MNYRTVIGLEIHVELNTASKLFCGCSTDFGAEPNTHCCPVCAGLPGSLPMLNRWALELALRAALSLKSRINLFSRFDRKNYFYPDLPKAYQISQHYYPLAEGGHLEIDMEEGIKKVHLQRVHLEEDTGKLLHADDSIMDSGYSLVDYNRCGIPLLEVVTAPEITSGRQARLFLEELRLLLLYAGVSDCRMEEGSMRCDANISLAPPGKDLGTKVEVKNMNSFRAVEAALNHEEERQRKVLSSSQVLHQETRHWDESARHTYSLRGKEEESDYRYFPEPDLPPLQLKESWIEKILTSLPESPARRRKRFQEQYRLEPGDAEVLTSSPELAEFYEAAARSKTDPVVLAHWVKGEVLGLVKEKHLRVEELDPSPLVETLNLLNRGKINRNVAKDILAEALLKEVSPSRLVSSRGLERITDQEQLLPLVEKVLAENPRAVETYLAGREKAFDFLMGKVMGMTKGRADPVTVKQMISEQLALINPERGPKA